MFSRDPARRETGPLPHECYVWQRVWSEDLRAAIGRAESDLKGLTVLAAEIDVRPGRQQQQIMPVDYSFLSTVSQSVGIAIRINPYSGPFDTEAPAAQTIRKVIKTVLEKAATAGFEPVEIQIDYDCAESKLAGYRTWIRSLKKSFSEHPIIITALPSWMKHRRFKKLVQSCDGYILQVHSLERPKTVDDAITLCDPERAVKWTRQADRLGVPFRLALPTYGYLVSFDEEGAFVSLSAEGSLPKRSGKMQIKTVLSDSKKILAMIQEIQTISPKNLSGVIWFRLPIAGDQLNWQWHTLQRLVQNQPLTEQVEVLLEWPQPNLAEVYLVNSGDVDVTDVLMVQLEFAGECLAADGVQGYSVQEDPKGRLLIHCENRLPYQHLRSQEKINIAWCRFDKETEVKASVQKDLQ
ncbi:MAG: DUF3142 domain-containing protein [Planctomycetota bacterium]